MANRLLVACLVLLGAGTAHALTVLTAGKHAVFRTDSALVRIGKDRALATVLDPTCASGLATTFQVGAYLQSTWRLASSPEVTLPCDKWRKTRAGYAYEDDAGTSGGVQRITYTPKKLVIQLGGSGYAAPAGPVGYIETWLTLGTTRLLARFHGFRQNTATRLVTQKPSAAGAEGEAGFWDVILGDDNSEARQQATIAALTKAVRRSKRDGRSYFLLGMIHLYRFGVRTPDWRAVTDEAKGEIRAADVAFDKAVPLLWNGQVGDSRVPGFAAATKFARGIAEGDTALADAGYAALDVAIAVNGFFNAFDLIPVIQAVPRTDPRFQPSLDKIRAYLSNPEVGRCVNDQPELCNNRGFAPRNLSGTLLLFGDVNAKAGDAAAAKSLYDLAALFNDPTYEFASLVTARQQDVNARVARYLDDDPANDDPIVGAGEQTCATCHHR